MDLTPAMDPHALPPAAVDSEVHRKVVFASAHSLVDFSNGASVATLDVLRGLAASGFECGAFTTSRLDLAGAVPFEEALARWSGTQVSRTGTDGPEEVRVFRTQRGPVPITIVRLEPGRNDGPRPEEVSAVLALFRAYLEAERPDVMLTYGGDPISQGMIALARSRGVAVVFAIHNFAYTDRGPFRHVDQCILPSEFAMRYYRDVIGLPCRVLPNPVDWDRVRVEGDERRFVTFVNPVPEKGVFPFVPIAQELGRRRPDIPLLVVEGRGTRAALAACGLGRDSEVNVQIMANTADPRRFWRMTRVLVVPSLWWESQCLVAVEAMINGIPVVASDRGGIPETLGGAGIVLPLPDRITQATRELPTAEEMEPWVEAILRLWDDRAWYDEQSERARNEALRWHPDRLRPLYAEFFRGV